MRSNGRSILMISSFHRVVSICILLAAACAYAARPLGYDLNGQPIRDLGGPGIRVVVLIFATTDCPISNRYVPEVARLSQEFSVRGVRFWWVFPDPEDKPAAIAKHNREFAIHESTLRDSSQEMVRSAHVTITPEAAMFLVAGEQLHEVYHGRIDDQYISLGEQRPRAQNHELERAIVAALGGQPIPQPSGPPVGCSIVLSQK
jgi:AhpC/TSA family protein